MLQATTDVHEAPVTYLGLRPGQVRRVRYHQGHGFKGQEVGKWAVCRSMARYGGQVCVSIESEEHKPYHAN